jgi:hypothetical protein
MLAAPKHRYERENERVLALVQRSSTRCRTPARWSLCSAQVLKAAD